MSSILRLKGRAALSAFRLDKLLDSASSAANRVSRIHAEYWHFAQVERPLAAGEEAKLARLLTYGPARAAVEAGGALLLVVPRIGSIFSWSANATDNVPDAGPDS